jgi:hypothetical protein
VSEAGHDPAGDHQGRWPTFLVIGAARAGTTTVHGLLLQHPQVFVPRNKEPNFFALRAIGLDLDTVPALHRVQWGHAVTDPARYRMLFVQPPAEPPAEPPPGRPSEADAPDAVELPAGPPAPPPEPRALGECSPVYLAVPGTAAQIHGIIPEARLIAILRDPVARAISHHAHNLASGVEQETDFAAALAADEARGAHSNYFRQGFYASLLGPYLELFGSDRLLLLDQRELAADAPALMDRVFAHIGVNTGVPLHLSDPALPTTPAPVPDTVRADLAARYRPDTRRLADELGFESARAWSSY